MSTSLAVRSTRSPGATPSPRSWRAALKAPLRAVLVLACGGALGLGVTALVLDRKHDPAALTIGAWVTWPNAGTSAIDPYARAIDAQNGTIALAAAEGLAFTASVDDAGVPLSARCEYRIAGSFPAARFWTLSASTPDGRVMDNPAGRYGYTSTDVLRRDDGSFDVVLAPLVRPGNWLPLSGGKGVVLTLRLYDTPLASVGGGLAKAALPAIASTGCAS